MFPPSLIGEAVALATSCADRGIAINSSSESFLDNLIAMSCNSVDTQFSSRTDSGEVIDRTYFYGDDSAYCQKHAAFTDESVAAAVEILRRNIMVARTDALPLIEEVMDQFEQVINPDIPYAYRRKSVVPVAFHPLWQNQYIIEAGETYSDGNNAGQIPAGLVLSVEEEQFVNFVELTKTGLPQVDKELETLLATYEENDLKALFHQVFSAGSMPVVSGPASLTSSWVNDNLLIYVWARALTDMTPAKSAHNLASYKLGVATVLARAGGNIWNINKVRQNCAQGNVLILSYAGDETYVHSDIYTDWLKAGGSPEIILGASLLQGTLRPASAGDLTAQAEQLIKGWNSYVSTTARTEQENLNATARQELFRLIRNFIEKRKVEGLIAVAEDAYTVLNGSIDLLPTNFIKDPYPHVRNIVLAVFYTGTDVSNFVLAMDEVASDDDDLSDDEIAMLATINYMADWGAELVTVRRGNL